MAIPSFLIITVHSDDDGDDDGIVNICDKISSFGFYDDNDNDNDIKRHQKNYDAVMTL